jgi:uncharacterized cofD-like protein
MPKNKKIVVIGGGTGAFTVLTGLRKYHCDLSAIVSMADDGGSTGVLREEFGILPPGDIRRALVALASADRKILSDLFSYRFEEGWGFAGHSFGNLFLTVLERLTGSFKNAVKEASQLLGVKGEVIPVTLQKTTLFAKLEDGRIIKGETNIDIPKHDGRIKIESVYLKPKPKANPEAILAINKASAIVIGPGDLYTSIIPNLLVSGIPEAIRKSPAKKIYVCNLMTKFGETYGFRASDFLNTIQRYLGENVIDFFIVNSKRPTPERLRPYIRENSDVVEIDEENLGRNPILIKADLLRKKGTLLRHDPDRLARLLYMLA